MLIKVRDRAKYSNGYFLKRKGLQFFYICWDSLTQDDSKGWRLTSSLPGYKGKYWKFSDVEEAIEKANDLLKGWLAATDLTIKRVLPTEKSE